MGAVVLVIGLGAVRLMLGPISVDFVQPTLERELNRRLGGHRIEFEHTVIAWQGWRRGLDILATDVVLRNPAGLKVIELPQLSVGLDPVELIQARVAPNRIVLFEPTIKLSRRQDGSFGFRREDRAAAASEQMAQGFGAALLTDPQEAAAGLRRIKVENATIIIDDLAQQQDWTIDGATLDARRSDDGVQVALVGTLIAGDRSVGLDAALDYSQITGRFAVDLAVQDAVPAMLVRPIGPLGSLAGVDVPVSGSVLLSAAPDGRLDRIEFDLDVAAGSLDLDLWPSPLKLDSATFKAVLDRNAGRLDVSNASVTVQGGTVTGSAVLVSSDDGVLVEAEALVDRLRFRTFAALWPPAIKANTRRWFDRNVRAGRIMNGKLNLTVRPRAAGAGSDADFRFAFGFDGLELHYIRPMPPMSGASGNAVLLPGSFEVHVDDGRIADPETGMNIRIAGLHGLMSNLDLPITHEADITLALTAPVSGILTLIDYQPLGYASDYGVTPESLEGSTKVRANFVFPLIDELTVDDVEFKVLGVIDDLLVPDAPAFLREQPGTVTMAVEREGLRAVGTVFAWDSPVAVTWQEQFQAEDELPTRFTIAANLADDRLYELGAPDAVEIEGTLPVRVTLLGNGVRIAEGKVTADLSPPAIALPVIGWSKPAGEVGTATVAVATVGNQLLPSEVSAVAPDLKLQGRVQFNASGTLAGAQLHQLQVGQTDTALGVRVGAGGALELDITGRQLDLRPFLESDDDEEGEAIDAIITVAVDRVIGARELVMSGVQGLLALDDGRFDEAQIAGSFQSGETLFIDFHPANGGRALTVETDNAGMLVAALDLYDNAVGGRLALKANVTGQGDRRRTTGVLDVKDFRITGAPGLARVLTLGSFTGIVDTLSGDGLSFDRLRAEFDHLGGDLTIKRAQATGSQLGIKMEGRAYEDLSKLDIRGTLAPAYSLNTALNMVPLVGAVLSGGQDEGLFAFRFAVNGPIDDPEVSVNALSALTPGILRGVFDVFDPPRRAPKREEPAPTTAETGSPEN